MQATSQLNVEPGAIQGEQVPNGLTSAVQGPPDWGVLDASDAASFVSATPVTLAAGTILVRVFSYPTTVDPFPSYEVGSWWCPGSVPPTEAQWRGELAVEVSWNGGQYAVTWTTPQQIYAWQGPAANQPGEYVNGDPAPDYYLPGGGTQIYIAPTLMSIGNWQAGGSPWNSNLDESAAPPLAAIDDQTHNGLAERVAQLSGLLAAMANEGQRKGVYTAPLRFQADRLLKANQDLQKYKASPRHLRAITHGLTGISRYIHTYYPWSKHSTEAKNLLRDIVQRAWRLI
jgi:hypothetical protein